MCTVSSTNTYSDSNDSFRRISNFGIPQLVEELLLAILNTIGTVTYYAEGTNDLSSCSSTSRTPVTLTINPKPAPPISGGNQVCAQSPVQTLQLLQRLGQENLLFGITHLRRYNSNPFLNVVGSITHYAETRIMQTGCISTRTSVSLTIDPLQMLLWCWK
jgi:hypothetical protein